MERKTANKHVWNILLIVFTIVLCYFFVVGYFFYISPCDISLKLSLWPFSTTKTMGNLYQDSIVQIEFKDKDETTLEEVDRQILGVNVDKNGYILAPLHLIESKFAQTDYKILANDGSVFDGQLVYKEKNYNLAVFKCERITDKENPIKLPYVKIGDVSDLYYADVVATNPVSNQTYDGLIIENNVIAKNEMEFDSKIGLKFVLQDCFTVSLEYIDFNGGAIFDRKGSLLGFSFSEADDYGDYLIMAVKGARLFMDKVISAQKEDAIYENKLALAFVGFDKNELDCHFLASNKNENAENKQYFYFENAWHIYTQSINTYHQQREIFGFYLFEDFCYNQQTLIEKDNIITEIDVNATKFYIEDKYDLIDLCFSLKTGDQVKLTYKKVGQAKQQTTFVV